MTMPNMPMPLSDRAARKYRRKLFKRCSKSHKIYCKVWDMFNFYDIYFDERISEKMRITYKKFTKYQHEILYWINDYCKIAQERAYELKYGDINESI